MVGLLTRLSLVEWIGILWTLILLVVMLIYGARAEADRAWNAFLQSFRWVMVGVMLAISTDAYLGTESLVLKSVILITAIIFLFITEYHLRGVEPDSE